MRSHLVGFRPGVTAILILSLLTLGATPLLAQQDPLEAALPVEQAAPPDEVAPPAPVPPAEIANGATEAINRLRETRRVATARAEVQEIAEKLPDKIAALDEFRTSEVNGNLAGAAPKLLEEVHQQWQRFESDLKRWNGTLDDRFGQLKIARDEITHLGEVWRLTAEAPAMAELPEAVRQQIASVRAEIGATEAEVHTRQEILLTLQNQISAQRIVVATFLEDIDAQLVARQEELFTATVPPLWRPVGEGPVTTQVWNDLEETAQRVAAGLREFAADFRRQMSIHLVSFVLLALVIMLLNRRTGTGTESEGELVTARSLLRKPVAASGLVTIIVSSTFYIGAPVVMQSIVPIVALPFAAWLTPGLVPAERRRLVYTVLVLTLLINLQSLIVAQGALRQISMVVIAGLGLVQLERLRRRMRRESPVIWPGISRTGLVIGWPTLVTTFAAAVLGFLTFAETLATAVIESAYVAYLLLAATRVIDALVFLLLRTASAQRISSVRLHTAGVRRQINGLVRLAAFVFWVWVMLDRLLVRDMIVKGAVGILSRYWHIGGLRISLGAVLLFILVLWITVFLSRIVRTLLQEDVLPRADMGRGRSQMISMLVNYSIIGLGFLAALAAAGIEIEQFAIIGGALGVGIGFGLQNVVSNFVSGLILVFERPVQVGDTVEVGTLVGTVRRIGIRSSTVRTFDEAEVIVPNSDLISRHVVNWTLSDQLRRMEVKVGVAYGTDPAPVQEILVAVAKQHAKVLEYPAPYALFKGFGDSSLDFVVRFWTSDFGNWIFIASEVTVAIEAALKEAGITIPFPQRDLHIYAVDPPAPIPDGGRVPSPPRSRSEGEASHLPQADADQ